MFPDSFRFYPFQRKTAPKYQLKKQTTSVWNNNRYRSPPPPLVSQTRFFFALSFSFYLYFFFSSYELLTLYPTLLLSQIHEKSLLYRSLTLHKIFFSHLIFNYYIDEVIPWHLICADMILLLNCMIIICIPVLLRIPTFNILPYAPSASGRLSFVVIPCRTLHLTTDRSFYRSARW